MNLFTLEPLHAAFPPEDFAGNGILPEVFPGMARSNMVLRVRAPSELLSSSTSSRPLLAIQTKSCEAKTVSHLILPSLSPHGLSQFALPRWRSSIPYTARYAPLRLYFP